MRRWAIFAAVLLVQAAAFGWSKFPLQDQDKIELALARGSASAPSAVFPIEVPGEPIACWWDDVAFHAGETSFSFADLGVKPTEGSLFKVRLPRKSGRDVTLEVLLKEKASAYQVGDFGILGNQTIDKPVSVTPQVDGRVRVYWNAVGPRSPRFIRDKKLPVKQGVTTTFDIHGTATDTGNVQFDIFDSDGQPLFMAFYPFHDPATKFAFVAIFTDRTNEVMKMHVDQWIGKGEKYVLTMKASEMMTGKDTGFVTSAVLPEKTGRAIVDLDVKGLPPGMFKMDYTVRDAQGKTIYSDYSYYGKPDHGHCLWDDTAFGTEDSVPPPWTQPEFAADGFSCWNRKLSFGNALLSSAVSAGREILSAPVTVDWNGRPLRFTAKLVKRGVSFADYRMEAEGAPVVVDVRAEFDGYMHFRLSYRTPVEALSLRIPVRRDRVVGFDDCSNPVEKLALPKGKKAEVAYDPGRKPWWWMGTATEGLMGGNQSLHGWHCQDIVRGYQLKVGDDVCEFRMNFVDTPCRAAGERTVEFYLQPTPVKPKDMAFALMPRGKFIIGSTSMARFCEVKYPGLLEMDAVEWAKQYKKRGEKYFYYCGTRLSSPVQPWWGWFADDWYEHPDPCFFAEEVNFKNRAARDRGVWVTGCLNSKSFFEHKLWGICSFLTHPDYGVENIYLDLAGPGRCHNVNHGCTWKDDFGRTQHDWSLFRFREFHKRIYREIKKKNPSANLMGHLQFQRTPSDVFFDRLLMGETYDRFVHATMSYYDVLNPEMMQIQYASRSAENVVDMLPQIDRILSMYAPEKLKTYDPHTPENDRINRHATAYFKIHDLEIVPQPNGANQWSDPDVALRAFGLERRHFAYYKPDAPVSLSSPDDRFLWCLYEGNGRQMLILLNDTDAEKAQTVAVKSLASVGRDIFNGRTFDFTKATCTVKLPPRESLFILFEPPSEKKAQSASVTDGPSVVFLGDEYTQFLKEPWGGKETWLRYWADAPYRAVNLGRAGDCTDDLLRRITEGKVLEGISPKAIVLLIGINDFTRRGAPVGDVVSGIRRILLAIRERQPQARTVLCSVFPRDGNPKGAYADRIDVLNAEMQRFADGHGVIWCDFTDRYQRLELGPGAVVWTSAVLPLVNEILRGDGLAVAPRCRALPPCGADDLLSPASVRPVSRIMEPSWRGENWWGDRFARNRDFIRAHQSRIDFVFAGSSSVHFWESSGGKEYAALTNRYVILNCGYGGDRTQNLLWRFGNGELDGYRAKGVVLSIGSNNNGVIGAKVADTVAGIKACLKLIARKQPQAKVVLLAYQPRAVGTKDGDPTKDSGADRRNRETSAEMAKLADGKKVFYVDVYDRFLVDGKLPKSLSADYIHPTEKGYGIIRTALEPVLAQIMEEK